MIRRIVLMLALCSIAPTAAADSPGALGEFEPPTPFAIPLSVAGPDQLQSAAPGPDGSFYAAGFYAAQVGGQRQIVVVKITAAGALDPSFGFAGVAETGLVSAGGADEIDVVAHNGKPLVSATIPHAGKPGDRNIALVRLGTTGMLDPVFGNGSPVVLNLNTAIDPGSGSLVGLDAARALAVSADGSIFVHAVQRGEGLASGGGPRLDTDFAMVKLTADGLVDSAFGGGDGKFLLDLQESNATTRSLAVLADESVIGMGYANSPIVGGTVQPVIYKLTSAGVLDSGFATGGVFHEVVLAIQAEVYGGVLHGNHLVTAGYGRNSGDVNEYLSLRFSALDGTRDPTWGGAPNGAVLIDPSGMQVGNNCRNAVALPDGRTVLIGSTGPANQPAQDAAFVVLTAAGMLDAGFGGGIQTFAFGTNGNDQFWGGAFNDGNALFVGYKGGGTAQTQALNDDAYAVILPIPTDVIFQNDFEIR